MLHVITQFRGWLAIRDVNMTSAISVKVQFTQMTKEHSVSLYIIHYIFKSK